MQSSQAIDKEVNLRDRRFQGITRYCIAHINLECELPEPVVDGKDENMQKDTK
jgi:hypothetical protein